MHAITLPPTTPPAIIQQQKVTQSKKFRDISSDADIEFKKKKERDYEPVKRQQHTPQKTLKPLNGDQPWSSPIILLRQKLENTEPPPVNEEKNISIQPNIEYFSLAESLLKLRKDNLQISSSTLKNITRQTLEDTENKIIISVLNIFDTVGFARKTNKAYGVFFLSHQGMFNEPFVHEIARVFALPMQSTEEFCKVLYNSLHSRLNQYGIEQAEWGRIFYEKEYGVEVI